MKDLVSYYTLFVSWSLWQAATVILLDILPFKTKKAEQACKMFKPTCTSVNGFYEFVFPSIDGGKGSLRVLCVWGVGRWVALSGTARNKDALVGVRSSNRLTFINLQNESHGRVYH